MIKKLYIYESDSFDPYINLATEKYLFDTLSKDSVILYLWQNDNTVVIGKNQNSWAECNYEQMKSDNIYLARRLSGGGAVFHDLGNLNFTFISEDENYNLEKQMNVISKACSIAGIDTEISGRNDILANEKKFSGNAFYNSKGKAYHHGTILICTDFLKMSKYLTPSKAKLKSKGVKSVRSRVINLSEISSILTTKKMKKYMIDAFEIVYGMSSKLISPIQNDEIEKLSNHYKSWEYLYGFNTPFSISFDGHFDWGNIEIQLNIKNGIIQEVRVFTDSMDWALSERIKKTLTGINFDIDNIKMSFGSNADTKENYDIFKLIKENLL